MFLPLIYIERTQYTTKNTKNTFKMNQNENCIDIINPVEHLKWRLNSRTDKNC